MRVVTHSYDSYDQAARVVDALERAGVPRDDITVISGDTAGRLPPPASLRTSPPGQERVQRSVPP